MNPKDKKFQIPPEVLDAFLKKNRHLKPINRTDWLREEKIALTDFCAGWHAYKSINQD